MLETFLWFLVPSVPLISCTARYTTWREDDSVTADKRVIAGIYVQSDDVVASSPPLGIACLLLTPMLFTQLMFYQPMEQLIKDRARLLLVSS